MESAISGYNTFLIIDQGNTLIKVALFSGTTLLWVQGYETITRQMIEDLKLEAYNIKAGIVSSVSSDADSIIGLFPEIQWVILDKDTSLPIINRYDTPDTLGKDRLAGAVAGAHIYPGKNVLIIDAGTAITYDMVNSMNQYVGGSISPGINMRFKALHTFTKRLPLYEPAMYDKLTGTDTYQSIMSGVMVGARAEMDGIINEYEQKYQSLITILTGGDAIYFDKKLKSNIFATSNLVLSGLNLILQYHLEK